MEDRFRRIIGGFLLLLGFFSAWITEMPFDFSIIFFIPKTWPELVILFFLLWLVFSGLTKISMIIGWYKKWLNIISIALFFGIYLLTMIIFLPNGESATGLNFYQNLFSIIWILGWIVADTIDFIAMRKIK